MLRFACSFLAAAAVVLSCAVFGAGPAAATPTDGSCADGKFCVWTQGDYNGSKNSFGAGDAGEDLGLGAYDGSAKNRFGSRKVLIKDATRDVVDCLDPETNDPNLPGSAAYFRIGGSGSTC